MDPELRKSLAAKSVALGFIASILLGNYWIIQAIFHIELPLWFLNAVSAAALWTIVSGFWLLITKVIQHFDRNITYEDEKGDT